MTSRSDFARTVKRGRRSARKDIVVHALRIDGVGTGQKDVARRGGPRYGLVVSKSVGNSVTRHAVSRRLRHACMPTISHLGPDTLVVIRALASAREASTAELADQLRGGLDRLNLWDAA